MSESIVLKKLSEYDDGNGFRLVDKNGVLCRRVKRALAPFKEKYSKMDVLGESQPEIAYKGSEFRLMICGGRNGDSDWIAYMKEIVEVLERLKELFDDIWVIELDNDCLDDIFYLFAGARGARR